VVGGGGVTGAVATAVRYLQHTASIPEQMYLANTSPSCLKSATGNAGRYFALLALSTAVNPYPANVENRVSS
jgi:hypothetical protein